VEEVWATERILKMTNHSKNELIPTAVVKNEIIIPKAAVNDDVLFDSWITIGEFENKCLTGGIKRYEKFNRKKVWKQKNIDDLNNSIYKKDLYNPMVLVPIKLSIELAIKRGDKADELFFKGAYQDGKYQWLTLIGGNRGEAINKTLESNDDIHNEEYRKQLVPLIITKPLSREDIHRKFQADLGGVVPNRQEGRNSIWNGDDCESEWVRKQSSGNSKMILSKNGLGRDTERMLDDEFVASLGLFVRHGVFGNYNGKNYDDLLDDIYKENTTKAERKLIKQILKYLEQLWKKMPDKLSKENKQKKYWDALICMKGIMQEQNLTWFNSRKSPKQFITDFYSWWFDKLSDDETLYKPSKDNVTFKSMTGGFKRETHIGFLKNMLDVEFISEMLKKQILKVDRSEDLATPKQRNELISERKVNNDVWVRQNGSVEGVMFDKNLPEFIQVPLSEITNASSYPTDHINPKDLGGINEVSNMEITTQAYNSWKRKRLPDYKKLTLGDIENA